MVSFASGTLPRISSIAASPLARLRIAMTTSAPAAESRRASPKPRPLLAPVTIANFPDRSGTVATRSLDMGISLHFRWPWVTSSDTLRACAAGGLPRFRCPLPL